MISGAERVGGQDFGFRLISKSINIPPGGSRGCRELVSLKAVREKGGGTFIEEFMRLAGKDRSINRRSHNNPFKTHPSKPLFNSLLIVIVHVYLTVFIDAERVIFTYILHVKIKSHSA